jgi:hypothetical protein
MCAVMRSAKFYLSLFTSPYKVSSVSIDNMRAVLHAEDIPEMRGISSCHHVFSDDDGFICFRYLSCHCAPAPQHCLCYKPKKWVGYFDRIKNT